MESMSTKPTVEELAALLKKAAKRAARKEVRKQLRKIAPEAVDRLDLEKAAKLEQKGKPLGKKLEKRVKRLVASVAGGGARAKRDEAVRTVPDDEGKVGDEGRALAKANITVRTDPDRAVALSRSRVSGEL